MGEEEGVGDGGGRVHGSADDGGESEVEGGGEEDEVEEVFEKGDEVGVDEVYTGGNGGVEVGDAVGNCFGFSKGVLFAKRVRP